MHKKYSRFAAFTLIELSVVLLVVGLMVGFGMQAAQVSTNVDCYAQTRTQIVTIKDALQRFIDSKGRLPTPAGRSFNVTSPNYGREASGGAIDTLASGAFASNPVLFGALPFQALQLPTSFATDCWGNKFSYVVGQNFTTTGSFPSAIGPITVRRGTLGTSVPVTTQAGYAVISHGSDAAGAVKGNYGAASHGWCSVGTRIDSENCDLTNATLYYTDQNNGTNPAAFSDDLVSYGGKKLDPANGVCDITVALGCIAGTATSDNGQSACNQTRTWVCAGQNGGANSGTCSLANPACPVNGVCNNSVQYGCAPGSAASQNPGSCGGSSTWVCAGSGGGTTSGTCSIANAACPVNGVCNNSVQYACTTGSSTSNVAGSCGGSSTWTCAGSGGGSSASCSKANAACVVNGVCNNSVQYACTTGSSTSNVAGSCGGSSTWTCSGSGGGSNASCSKANAACPVNGACGGADWSCNAGSPANGADSGCNGAKTWQCIGANGGSTSNCSNANAACAVPVNGSCNEPGLTCNSGTVIGFTSPGCGGFAYWSCQGSNGGSTQACARELPDCVSCPDVIGGCNGVSFTTNYVTCAGGEICNQNTYFDVGCNEYITTGNCQ
ncbi:MAG: hypothetical protein ACKVOE_05975 [Rickettsiales bacterium]